MAREPVYKGGWGSQVRIELVNLSLKSILLYA